MELDEEVREIVHSKVPKMWRLVAYPSSLDLQIFVRDLVKRLKFLEVSCNFSKTFLLIVIFLSFYLTYRNCLLVTRGKYGYLDFTELNHI